MHTYISFKSSFEIVCEIHQSVDTVLPDVDKLFEHDLGALNMAALNRKVERAGLLSNLGPCCKALCARRDFAIRRQLLKNEKVKLQHC